MKEKSFPCPACKGKGGEIDVTLDDGTGPYTPCTEYHLDIMMGNINTKINVFLNQANCGFENLNEANEGEYWNWFTDLDNILVMAKNHIQKRIKEVNNA
jgi:hypothetical protein